MGEKEKKSISPVFTPDLIHSIEKVVNFQALREPKGKVCLLWVAGRMESNRPRMICFRKVLLDRKEVISRLIQKLQIIVSEDAGEFENIIESPDDDKDRWRTITAPQQVEKKLSPMLSLIQLEIKEPESHLKWLQRVYRPHINFWSRYLENWSNGQHLELLGKFRNSLLNGYPQEFVGRCFAKVSNIKNTFWK
jgi:hypothetical protein